MQESHFFTNPCTGASTLLSESSALDLDPFVCSYVELSGPDVGIECEVIQPTSAAAYSTSCPIQFDELWLTDETANHVNWFRVTCAASYDVVRGNLSAVTPGISQIDLGPVQCLGENVPQENWWFISGPADGETPPVGQAFFYLVRPRSLALGDETYGHSSDNRERAPFSGDCSF
ncbi:MAG TPA: hypothetical protein VGR38_03275 [Candidatus Polarisedimenticolia bacterium]|jgi:hypothetical protein|nr:hypothetical protein [Candidatus Polarisedimenticolia bacterium]